MLGKIVSWIMPAIIAKRMAANRDQVLNLSRESDMKAKLAGDQVLIVLETNELDATGEHAEVGYVGRVSAAGIEKLQATAAFTEGVQCGAQIAAQWQLDLNMQEARRLRRAIKKATATPKVTTAPAAEPIETVVMRADEPSPPMVASPMPA